MKTLTIGSGTGSAIGATQLIAEGDSPTLVNNADVANTLYLSNTASTNIFDSDNVVALLPGQSVTFDGTIPVFGFAAPLQSVAVDLIPGATGISLSILQAELIASNLAKETGGNLAAINSNGGATNVALFGSAPSALTGSIGGTVAKDISKTGAPGLRFTNNQGFSTPGVILTPGLGVQLVGNVGNGNNAPVNQMGYEAEFFLFMGSGVGTVPFASIIVNWFDATSGLSVSSDFFILAAGNGSLNGLTYYLSGPCKGDIMNMQIINLDPAQNMTLQYTVNQNSHIYTRDRLIQPVYAGVAPIGFTNPNGTGGLGILAIMNPTVAALASSSRLLAAFNGKVGLNIDARSQANNISYTLQDPGSLYSGTANGIFWSADTIAGGAQLYEEVVLPNGPVLLTEINRGASGTVNPTVAITKLEY